MSFVIICVISLVAGLLLYWKVIADHMEINSKLSKIPKLPIPYYPVIGHLLSLPGHSELFTKLVSLFDELASSKAKLATIYVGLRPKIWCFHPDTAEIVLKNSKNLSKGATYNFIRLWIKDGLVTSTGKKWQKRRRMITPTFHYDILKDFLNIMNEHADGFIDCIEEDLVNGSQIDFKQRLKMCTLDIICETAMGCKIHAQEGGGSEDSAYVEAVQKYGGFVIARRFNPLLKFDFIFNRTSVGKDHNKTLKILHGFTRRVIDKKLSVSRGQTTAAAPKQRKAFLDMLIASKTEDGRSLSADDIQEEVDTFMFAGHDTTSIALMWGIYLLGLYPEKQTKLQEELDSVFAGDNTCDVTLDHIKDLTYMDLVVKEMLRLYPSAPIIGRTLDEELVVDGVTLPKGQDISVFIYYINRHPHIWEAPNKFIPERFETENRLKSNQSSYSYIPFSAGVRNCVGQRFALQEIKVILAKFFRRFAVVSRTPEDEVVIEMGVVMETLQKLDISVTKRRVV